MNKDRLIEAEIGDNKEYYVYYRCAPCLGVKVSRKGCNYIAPTREKRGCKNHTQWKLIWSEGYPVEMVYILHPQNFKSDNRRSIGGIVRHQNGVSKSLPNHKKVFKIWNLAKDNISSSAMHSNVGLTLKDISQGSGFRFISSAVDTASSHLGRVATEAAKTNCSGHDWSPYSLEAAVDDRQRWLTEEWW